MKAIILAAGYAVRLQPLTLNTSKSLLDVGGKKIIDRILDKVAELDGLSSIYVVSNGKFFDNFNEWLKGSKYKRKVEIINDGSTTNDNRLGAIKDMEFAIRTKAIDDDLLVIAGDNLFDFELGKFMEFARRRPEGVTLALYDVKSLELAKNFGVIRTDKDGRIVEFEEKPQAPKSTLISTGIYYFPKNKLPFIKEYVKIQDKLDAPGYYIKWLSGKDKVYGVAFLEDWYDIGNIESYKKADMQYTEKEKKQNGKE